MKIKRYLVTDMREALRLIKADLGPDAVIISSRHVKAEGLLGYLKPRRLEVTAALDSPLLGLERGGASAPGTGPSAASSEMDDGSAALRQEIAELKNLVSLAFQQQGDGSEIASWTDYLVDREVDPAIAEQVVKQAAALGRFPGAEDVESEQVLKEAISTSIANYYQDLKFKKTIVFVGPTGVGKTTTLAKMAGQFVLFGRSVAIITIDTFRIGAVDQIRTYAEIMGVPFTVANSPAEFKEALRAYDDKDYILVDTAGRPSYNYQQVMLTKRFIDAIDLSFDGLLVLSAPTKLSDLARQASDFVPLRYSKIVVTKIDETRTLGSLLNLVHWTEKPVVHVTNGQSVPDDIQTANPERLASWVLRGDVYVVGSGG